MSTHTPGPWTAGHARKDSNYGGYAVRLTAQDDRGLCSVAKVYGGNHDDPEHAEANAALIAAAPDLLAACKAVAAMAVRWEPLTPGDIAEVHAAIAKAVQP